MIHFLLSIRLLVILIFLLFFELINLSITEKSKDVQGCVVKSLLYIWSPQPFNPLLKGGQGSVFWNLLHKDSRRMQVNAHVCMHTHTSFLHK